MKHYRQCSINVDGICVCEEIRLLDVTQWDLYARHELDAERIKGRQEGLLVSLPVLAAVIIILILTLT